MTTPVEGTVRPRGSGPSPELVGGLLVLVILALAATTLLGGGAGAAGPGDATPTPSVSVAPSPTRILRVDPAVADLLLNVNSQILDAGDRLTAELERDPFRPADIRIVITEISGLARYAVDAVASLGSSAVAIGMIERLGPIYASLEEIAASTFRASIQNEPAHRSGGEAMVEALVPLPGLQAELEELREGTAPPTPAPPTSSPRPSPTSSPDATPTPAPSPPSPSPTAAASPSASTGTGALGPSQIVNGGFESGVGPPWELRIHPAASATVEADQVVHASGTRSARIEIAAATTAFGSVTLRQPGLRLDAGGRYTVRVGLRAAESREVRIYLVSQSGQTYLTRVATAGLDWTAASFTFTAPVSDADAVLEVGLGRTPVTTWLDDVWLSTSTTP
jgi:hypothetical protein